MTSPAPVTSAGPDAGTWRAPGRARPGAGDAVWEREYGRDVWRLHELGIKDRIARISFTGIPQPWLKNLAKRWARWRLSTGQVAETAALSVRAVRRFAAFLASPAVTADRLAQVDRPLLERYLAYLHAELAGRTVHRHMIGQLNLFFTAIRQHGWDSTLPTNAMFFPEDLPKEPQWLPRALSEHVMAQLERPDNLNRWNIPAYQLVTLILMRCGLRITDALGLPGDCIVRDANGAPYLRYYNHKMKREALVPVDEELERAIGEHRQRLRTRWPGGNSAAVPQTHRQPRRAAARR